MEKTNKKERPYLLRPMDFFFIAVAAIVLTAVIGQSVAVYITDRAARSETLTLAFDMRSVEKSTAETMYKKISETRPIEVKNGMKTLGKITGQVVITPLDAEGENGSYRLCDVTATIDCKGSVSKDVFSVYGVGTVNKGDVLSLYIDGELFSVQVRSIGLKSAAASEEAA